MLKPSIATVLILAGFLSLGVDPAWADPDPELHVDRARLKRGSYGPIRPSDTLWSVSKLFMKKGESIHAVIEELARSNPQAIMPDYKLIVGASLQRSAALNPSTTAAVNPASSSSSEPAQTTTIQPPPIQAPVTAESATATLTLAESSVATVASTPIAPLATTDQLTATAMPASALADNNQADYRYRYLLGLGTLLLLGWFWGLPHLRKHLHNKRLEQARIAQANAAQRQSVKDRLQITLAAERLITR